MKRHHTQRYFGREQLSGRARTSEIVHWFGGGSGVSVTDQTGYGNHAAFVNGPTWTVDSKGCAAIKFDGTDDYISTALPPQALYPSAVSIAFRAKLNATPSLVNLLNWCGSDVLFLAYWWNSGNGMIVRSGSSTNNTASLVVDFDITKEHHWVFTWDANIANLPVIYTDGIANSQSDGTALSSADANVLEFSRGVGGGFQSAMTLSDVRCYNRVLSTAEITMLSRAEFKPVVSVGRHRAKRAAGGATAFPDHYYRMMRAS